MSKSKLKYHNQIFPQSIMRQLLLLTPLLSGCSTQQFYYNHAVSFRYQPEQYNYDLATCQRIAAANAPIPPIRIEYNGPRYVYGTADITGGGIAQQVRYSGYVYQAPTFTSGFAQGWQIGSAAAAAVNQNTIAQNCMAQSGWVKTSEFYTPMHGNRQLLENRLLLDWVNQGFTDMIKGGDGTLFVWDPSASYIDTNGTWKVTIADVRPNNTSFLCTYRGGTPNTTTAEISCNDGSTGVLNSYQSDSAIGRYLSMMQQR
jgi:hypothetical protein